MQWIITADSIDTDKVGFGTTLGKTAEQLPFCFRLLDDDGIVYYEGHSDDRDSQAAFWPLDWAAAYAGCTVIEYLRAGKWEVL